MRVRLLLLTVALSSWLGGATDAAAQLKLPGLELPHPGAPKPPAPVADAAKPISALSIPDRAWEVDTTLREARQLRNAPELERIRAGLPHFWGELSELSRISGSTIPGSRRRGLYDLMLRWDALHNQLAGWEQLVKRRTTAVEAHQAAIRTLNKTWSATAEALASDPRAPRAARVKVGQVLSELGEAGEFLSAGTERTFELQDRLRGARQALESNLARVRSELDDDEAVLRATAPPLWRFVHALAIGAVPRPQAHGEYLGMGLRAYWQQYGRWLPFDACLLLALVAAAVLLARRARARMAEQPESDILNAAATGAMLIALICARFLHPKSMFAVLDLLGLASLVPLSSLTPLLVRQAAMVPPSRALLGVLVLHRALMLLHLENPWHDFSVLVVGTLLLAAIAWARQSRARLGLAVAPGRLDRSINLFTSIALIGLGVGVMAGVLGYAALLELLVDGFTASTYWLLVSIALTRVLYAFVSAGLDADLVKQLGSMRNHGELIRLRALTAARWAGIALWTSATLYGFGIVDPVRSGLTHLLGVHAEIGSWSISLGDLARFALTMYLAAKAAGLFSFVLDEDLLPRLNLARGLPATISRLSRYVILAFGFLLAVGAAGVNMSQIALLASALSVGIGFGLQNVVNNFVSGLILIFERPIRIGDTVQLGELVGEVRQIGIRASTVRTAQGAEVILPNAELISNRVVNWTLSDLKRRIEIPVGVAYGSDPDHVIEVMTSAVAEIDEIESYPAPICIFTGFGDSALNFELRVWVRRTDDWPNVRSTVLVALCRKLTEAGVEIPFPQRDLHLRSVDEAAGRALLERS
jgi:potassium-dependent mechanosensitive channel